jgi:hypothetical protein
MPWKIRFTNYKGEQRTVYSGVTNREDAEAVAKAVVTVYSGVRRPSTDFEVRDWNPDRPDPDNDDRAISLEHAILWQLGR